MYEDSWYSFVPDFQHKRGTSQNLGHRRRQSLLQQPNGANQQDEAPEPLEELYEEEGPWELPEATLARRAKSYSDFYDIVREHLATNAPKKTTKAKQKKRQDKSWEALALREPDYVVDVQAPPLFDALQDELLEASQQDYILYGDQLAMTERHLDTLIADTNAALELLASLSESFRGVEEQTTSFKAQCEDILEEKQRLQKLADDVGTDLHYYAYLDNASRRLNAPGASRLVDDETFGEILTTLDSCTAFMEKHPTYRDAESYLARYQSLLTKALHLLEVGFTNLLEKVSSEIAKQIAATQSESARHALAYGRFEEMMRDSYALIPNVQRVVLSAYDQVGNAVSGGNQDIYSNTANNIFGAYIAARDRDLRLIIQHDLDNLAKEAKEASVETASRNFVKQSFERSFNEAMLFAKIFGVEPQYSTDPNSAFVTLKSHQRVMVNATNVVPIATNLQSTLQGADLQTICNILGWITNEYLAVDYDDDETPFVRHCQELAARLLTEHLWAFTDATFEAEIAKSISRAPVVADALKIGPVIDGVASSNAYPTTKRALELLIMFDQAMPKERCQRNSPVIFKIVKETIHALNRAEARVKASKNGTDSDLFMVKNLLILKNELVSLEIGDVRSQDPGMQHFGQIWETLSPQNLIGYFSSFIPGSLWPRNASPAGKPPSTPTDQDASEQLDEMLRQSIYAFTQRWATLINDARKRKLGARPLAKVEQELESILQTAFSNQPEVIGKLKEAIQLNAQAQDDASNGKKGNKITRV
ncbi:Conserved oligomeric Golgi complex subunit 3 [Pleurostoma richardsiae]|uniref:Conserved oligomeric Golgi complex subunit 3 n=1 Tax=Pleurostoma richardsiae TaxID=41990 RepID=A0AA38VK03_9PEZI|nr:Conserved oligomeric Golgi complex subunit 3 [Pleurostoma richardsiae]